MKYQHYFYFNLITKNSETIQSKHYDSKLEAVEDFVKCVKEGPDVAWGQLIEFNDAYLETSEFRKETILTLSAPEFERLKNTYTVVVNYGGDENSYNVRKYSMDSGQEAGEFLVSEMTRLTSKHGIEWEQTGPTKIVRPGLYLEVHVLENGKEII